MSRQQRNPYIGVPKWEHVWQLFHEMHLRWSSAREDIYAGSHYIGTLEEVARMSPADVRYRMYGEATYEQVQQDVEGHP